MTSFKYTMPRGAGVALVAAMATLALAGCRPSDPGTRIAGWAMIDSAQRHPIMVSQEPTSMSIRVPRGSSGLSPTQRARVLNFYAHFRATDAGNSRLVINAPSGAPNEVAVMNAVQEIRYILTREGIPDSDISVEAIHVEGRGDPPIRLSYLQYVAHAPECGDWTTNLAREPANLPYPNFGCATQRNFAVQVANPADLLGPRNMTPRSSERRDTTWAKYVKGDTTAAKKSEDEKISTTGDN
ncbi:Pilus (Caulobacter type) biogenesis lipoprotein CpaD [Candidatus Filomicrobium marinum]|uniref:Pilus (Caulobacter type) biogenesis lipoprotein CpaD n=2 Tax=Filomicrobium TaxID=119044 RepID=A0A0D6JEQ6_9HYPH|nr:MULTISPECIES: CpaD family pilus assembly protein [Filomicrobium]MCV0370302.1 CpaD family pilus assembly protein [Filomicrobium sp.]CFX22432.1 Pilus (Caulobacter type) biogenesis lipoprotein CpaD [Candidatus Filomicrobium marinum]CPR18915.1 Pilus (Caulobacter type) biogenesis lipoprotein CpaD [Candidatus Filomicrobium marinum]SDO12588.1 pilus assembly protein CpaD [Filomicrobium insigne]